MLAFAIALKACLYLANCRILSPITEAFQRNQSACHRLNTLRTMLALDFHHRPRCVAPHLQERLLELRQKCLSHFVRRLLALDCDLTGGPETEAESVCHPC